MDPIVLNEFGETLCVDERFRPVTLFGTLGTHGICGGGIHAVAVSKTHRVLFCDRCNLRMHIPVELDDYPGLRQWCATNLAECEETRERLRRLSDQHAVYGPLSDSNLLRELQDTEQHLASLAESQRERTARMNREEGEDALIDLT